MIENKIWLRHNVISGLVLGASLSVIEFIALYLGLIFTPFLSNIYVIIVSFSVFTAIKKIRDNEFKGIINLGNAFLTGLMVCAVAGLVWAIYRYFQYLLVPGVVEEIIKTQEEALIASSYSTELKDLLVETNKTVTNASTLAFINTFFGNMVLGGSFLSLFLGFALRREKIKVQNKTKF